MSFSERENCFLARYSASTSNADMVGLVVGVSNVVVVGCLRVLISWSHTHINVGIQTCLFQVYPILLSTLLSMNRQQLYIFDVNFALTVTSSPVTVYLVFVSSADLISFGKAGFYQRVGHRHTIRTLLILVLLIWLGLSLTLSLSNRAFKDSDLCDGSTLVDWLNDQIAYTRYRIFYPTYMGTYFGAFPLSALLFGLCLFRRRTLIMTDVRSFWKRASTWGRFFILWVVVKCTWRTIRRNHAWCILYLFALLDGVWMYQVFYSLWEVNHWKYELSYGQLLSVFGTIPVLISTFKVILLAFHRRKDSPLRLIWAEVRYLITGIGPEPSNLDDSLPLFNQPSPLLSPLPHPIPLEDGEGAQCAAFPLEPVACPSVSLAPERHRLHTPMKHRTI